MPKSNRGGRRSQAASAPPTQPQKTQAEIDAETVKNAIGDVGTPFSIPDAISGANPHFLESYQKRDKLYTHNCQRCVWATELRRRGYDVEAMPRTSDDSYAKADPSLPNSFLNVAVGGVHLKTVNKTWWQKPKASDITSMILQNPDGARGMLVMSGARSGHVLNWEVENGKAKIYDGQSNKTYSASALLKKFDYFRIGRMDNKDIAPLISDFVKKKGN